MSRRSGGRQQRRVRRCARADGGRSPGKVIYDAKCADCHGADGKGEDRPDPAFYPRRATTSGKA
jgi:mono/diheme cytochrome c family protein